MRKVDVITFGAGGGAYPAAFRLARSGRRVVMVDPKGVMSGNCLAEGCVPSKAVREMAETYSKASHSSYLGIQGELTVDLATVMAQKDRIQRARYAQHDAELGTLSENLSLLQGRARFVDAHTVMVESEHSEAQYRADHIIIATGADVFVPPLAGAEHCITSHDLFSLDPALTEIPDHLVVIGGGYIGLETASYFRAFGAEVTVIEMSEQLLPGMDPDFVAGLVDLLDPSIQFMTGTRVEAVERTDNGSLHVRYSRRQQEGLIEADTVLLAVGRHPVLPEGAADIGLQVEHGRVVVDEALRTNLPHIYACGDINGRVPLFHAAVGQSLVAAHNILGGDQSLDYFDFETVPTTIFTLPAAAYVGQIRSVLRERGISTIEAAYNFANDSRAQILGQTKGELRLFFEPGSLRLLGGWVLGLDAGHLVGEIGMAVFKSLTARDLAGFCNQHPMASEGIGKAAQQLF